ncbi:hypothetical protein OH77DRAFT_1514416 [Trametes cingulata]|nr:hypothetical protein OH77DRAFT_1514416 [Trametes cingulata]
MGVSGLNLETETLGSSAVPAYVVTQSSSSQIKISIPRNTGVPGAIVSHVTIQFPLDISFADFFDRVCAQMDLHPANTQIGYKYHTDRVRDPPHRLSNEQELREALDVGANLMQRARSRVIVMEIHNLNPATTSRKRKGAQECVDGDPNEPSTTLSFVKELRILKEHLACASHPGRYCYITPFNGTHVHLDTFKLTLWAKKIFLKEATLHQPPDTLGFDHVVKKPRRTKTPPSSATPAIHLHIPGVLPLDGTRGQRRINLQMSPPPTACQSASGCAVPSSPPSSSIIDLTRSPAQSQVSHAECPSVGELLVELDEKHPELAVLQYLPALHDCGYVWADSIKEYDVDKLMARCQMPFDTAVHVLIAAREAVEQTRPSPPPAPHHVDPSTPKTESPGDGALPHSPALSHAMSPPVSPSPSPSTSSFEASNEEL